MLKTEAFISVSITIFKQVVFIDQRYRSSKTCNSCGHILEKLDLSVGDARQAKPAIAV